MLLLAPESWSWELSSPCPPISVSLVALGQAESGLYFPPRTPEEPGDQAQTGDSGECQADPESAARPSFLDS